MAATLNRILAKVDSLGDEYFVLHSEIKPIRRFMWGDTEKSKTNTNCTEKFSRDLGEQTYMH